MCFCKLAALDLYLCNVNATVSNRCTMSFLVSEFEPLIRPIN